MGFRGKYYLQGNTLLEVSEVVFNKIHSAINVYEVIRIIEGKPLFLEKHCDRLHQSAKHINVNYKCDCDEMFGKIRTLVLNNNIVNGNIKIVLQYPGSGDSRFMFFIPHNYPKPEDFVQGIEMLSLIAERSQPNAKISNPSLRGRANQIIKETGAAEILLVDNKGFITEGSRSNIFLVRNNSIFTPTLDQVLPGVTRAMAIEICKQSGIDLIETNIKYSGLKMFQGAFITGTSPNILPVRKIDELNFQVAMPLIRKIMAGYEKLILEYLVGLDKIYGCGFRVDCT